MAYANIPLVRPVVENTAREAQLTRIKDVATIEGIRENQLIGYGIVVGLRGTGDTRTPMACHFLGYWVLGLPIGAALCFGRGYGAAGLWGGLTVGLIVIGIALTLVWRRTATRLAESAG